MSDWVGSKLDGIEARATAVADTGMANALSPVIIVKMAEDTLEMAAELRRLQAMEDRLKSLMAYVRAQIAKDRATAAKQGNSWLGVNTHTISANLLDTDLQNLERVLNG